MLSRAVVFCAFLAFSSAFLEQMELEPIPEKFKEQKGCYIEELDRVLPFGSSTPSLERCVEYRCTATRVTIAGCGVSVADPPCKIVEDKSKLFRECCPTIVCPKPDYTS